MSGSIATTFSADAARRKPIADRVPGFAGRHFLDQDLLGTGLVEHAQVDVELAAVELGAPPGIDPGHELVRHARRPGREHRDLLVRRGGLRDDLLELAAVDDADRHARRVVLGIAARHARGTRLRRALCLRHDGADLAQRDRAGPQHARHVIDARDDGRFQADLAVATLEHHGRVVAEFLAYVVGARRAHMTIAVRGRRREAAAETAQQLLRDRMRGHAHGDGVLSARDGRVDGRRTPQYERQRARPEPLGEQPCRLGDVERPAFERARVFDMDDQRMRRRTTLELEHAPDRIRVRRIGAEPVNGLGRENDELARAQCLDCAIDLFLWEPCRDHPQMISVTTRSVATRRVQCAKPSASITDFDAVQPIGRRCQPSLSRRSS